MIKLKERLINGTIVATVLFVVIGSAWIIYRTELLHNCVDAANESGKFYIETKECDYLTKGNK